MGYVNSVSKQSFAQEVLNSRIPVIVDFHAAWCGPCRMLAPRLEKLAAEFAGQVKIVKVDVDAESELADRFQIQSIPTLVLVTDGQVLGRTHGLVSEGGLRSVLRQLAGEATPAARRLG